MIKKSVGTLRHIIKYRKELIASVRNVLRADDVLVLSIENNKLHINGHTESTAMNLFLLGSGIAMAYNKAKEANPELEHTEFLHQPVSVAISQLTKSNSI